MNSKYFPTRPRKFRYSMYNIRMSEPNLIGPYYFVVPMHCSYINFILP